MKKFIGVIKFLSENKNLAIVHEIPLEQNLLMGEQFGETVTTTGGETVFSLSVAGYVQEGSIDIYEEGTGEPLGKDYPVGSEEGRAAILDAGIDFSFDGVELITSTGSIAVSTSEGILIGAGIENDLASGQLSVVNYETGAIDFVTVSAVPETSKVYPKYSRLVLPDADAPKQLKLVRVESDDFIGNPISVLVEDNLIAYTYVGEEANKIKPLTRFSE